MASINSHSVTYNSVNNQLYLTTTVNTCKIYDLASSSFLPITIALPTLGESSEFNFTDNTLYVASVSTDNVYVIDCFSNTIIATINLAGIIPVLLSFDSNQNRMYATSSTTNVAVIDCSTNTLITSIANPNTSEGIIFSAFNNSVYFASSGTNDISQVTTTGVTTTPYYISGSVNYNLFLNNLNNEPVSIQMFRLFVNNQNQLFNQLQLTKIDSNGNQIFLPNFPINEVSAYQQQGNIGEIPVEDVIFDGRTYINQYQINANENISFEIYYKQLDLTSASPSFPIFFKPKIQLKDYIKNN
jgi:YVTN family beta-propeller protein